MSDPNDEKRRRMIAGAVAEVDPRQIAITRRLTPAQRFAENVAAYRLRQRQAGLDEVEALRRVRSLHVEL